MFSQWLPAARTYDGAQLRAHWIADQTGHFGDAIVAFTGPAQVGATHMVDLEDVHAQAWIRSDDMLHFLIEHFDPDLPRMILRQRLLMTIAGDTIRQLAPTADFRRCGDDLMFGERKLSVSIATVSPLSGLIHTGLNIVSTNTPVPTIGLTDLGIAPRACADTIMAAYAAEITEMANARTKVRTVC